MINKFITKKEKKKRWDEGIESATTNSLSPSREREKEKNEKKEERRSTTAKRLIGKIALHYFFSPFRSTNSLAR